MLASKNSILIKVGFILIVILINISLYSCENATKENTEKNKEFCIDAGEDQTTYVGSYAILDPSNSYVEEEIDIIKWIQDEGNPENVYAFAHSTLEEINVIGFQKEGIYRFVMQINCASGNVYIDTTNITVQPRQVGLIEDISLETHIRYKLKYKEGELASNKLQKLDSLSTADIGLKNKITNIKGIEYCTNLIYLGLGLQSITDLMPLAGLIKLEYLNLNQNYTIEDISPICNLTNLKYLSLYSNPISDISGIGNLTKLTELYLMYTPVSDISSLNGLVNLEILYLSGVGEGITFKSIEPLKNLSKLIHLHLTGGGITDISVLSELTNLKLLDISYNNLTEISAVSKMKKLVRLYIRLNKVDDISGIKNLDNLDYLDAADNQIKDISELQYLSNIHLIGLSGNKIEDISPLVNNKDLGKGVHLYLGNNPLSEKSLNEYVPKLINRGVTVYTNL